MNLKPLVCSKSHFQGTVPSQRQSAPTCGSSLRCSLSTQLTHIPKTHFEKDFNLPGPSPLALKALPSSFLSSEKTLSCSTLPAHWKADLRAFTELEKGPPNLKVGPTDYLH